MGPSLLRPILVRAASLGAVLIIVLVLMVLILGITGFSDRILDAQVGEELRALRTATGLAAPGGKPGRRQDDARGRKPKAPARSKPRPPANRRQRPR